MTGIRINNQTVPPPGTEAPADPPADGTPAEAPAPDAADSSAEAAPDAERTEEAGQPVAPARVPTPDEVVGAIERVADADPALDPNDIFDHDNVTPTELDATIASASALQRPEEGLLRRAREAYVYRTPTGLASPHRLPGDEVRSVPHRVPVPELAEHHAVPADASEAIRDLAASDERHDGLRWTLSRLGALRSGELTPEEIQTEFSDRDFDIPDQPVVTRVASLLDDAEQRSGPVSDRLREAIDEATLLTAAAVAVRDGYGDTEVRRDFERFMTDHPELAEMAAAQVERLYAGGPFPASADGNQIPYQRATAPAMRAGALALMRDAAALQEDGGAYSSDAAISLLQNPELGWSWQGFISDDDELAIADEAMRTVLDREAFNWDSDDPGASSLVNYAAGIAEYARGQPRDSEEYQRAANAMGRLVGVLGEFGDQFASVDSERGSNDDPAYASVVRAVREQFLGAGARRPPLALEDVPEALALFQRIPSAADAELLASGGAPADAIRQRIMLEVPEPQRLAVAESLGDTGLAEPSAYSEPGRTIAALAPELSAAELARVRDGSGLGDEQIATLLDNAALYNALPAEERARLFESAGVDLVGALPPSVGAEVLLAAAAQGQLDGSPLGQILDPRRDGAALSEQVIDLRDDLLDAEFYAMTDLEAAIEQYDGDLDRLLSDIDEGLVTDAPRLASGVLREVVRARLEQRAGQASAVHALATSEETRRLAESALAAIESRTRGVEMALETHAIAELRRRGDDEDLRAADYLQARLLARGAVSPNSGAGDLNGPFTGAITDALEESPLERQPGESLEAFEARISEQRARVLEGLVGAQSELEADAWRTALDRVDPDFRRVWRDLQALEDLEFFSAVQSTEGARFSELAAYMEERSEPLRQIFGEPVPEERIAALATSLESAIASESLSERQREVLGQRLELVRQYDALLHDPRSGAAHLVDPDNFEASFENWLVEEGPAVAGGIATAVGAGLAASSIVGSGAAPGLALASARLLGTAAAISTGYHVGYNATDLALGTGADSAIWGPALRGEITGEEALSEAAREIALGTLFGAAAMGTTSAVLHGFRRSASSVLSRWADEDVARLRRVMDRAQLNSPRDAALLQRYGRELGQEGGQEVAQLGVQAISQAWLTGGPQAAAANFGLTVMTEAAFGARRSWRAANADALRNLGISDQHLGRVFEIDGDAAALPAFADQLRGSGANTEIVAPNVLRFSDPNGGPSAYVTTNPGLAAGFGEGAPTLAELVAANVDAPLPPLRAASTVGEVESFESIAPAIPEGTREPARVLIEAAGENGVSLAQVTALLDAQGTGYRVEEGRAILEPVRRTFGGTGLNELAARVGSRFDGTRVVIDPARLGNDGVAGFTDIDGRELGLSLRGLVTGRQSFVETHETHAHLQDVYRHGGALDIRVSSPDGIPLRGPFAEGPYATAFSFQELLGAAHTTRTLATGPVNPDAALSAEHARQLDASVAVGADVAVHTRELAARGLSALRQETPLSVEETEAGIAVSFVGEGGERFSVRLDADGLPTDPAARDTAIRASLRERFIGVEERANVLAGEFVAMERALAEGDRDALRRLAQGAHRYVSRQSAWLGDVPPVGLAVDRPGWARARVRTEAGDGAVGDGFSLSGVLRRTETLGALVREDAEPTEVYRAAADVRERAAEAAEEARAAASAVIAGNFELNGDLASVRYDREREARTLTFDLDGVDSSDPAAAQAELQRRLMTMSFVADGIATRANALSTSLIGEEGALPDAVHDEVVALQRLANGDFGGDRDAGVELGTADDVTLATYPLAIRMMEAGIPPDHVANAVGGLSLLSGASAPGYVFDPLTGSAVIDQEAPDRAALEREVTALRWMHSLPPQQVAGMVGALREANPAEWERFTQLTRAVQPDARRLADGEFAPGVTDHEAQSMALLAAYYVRRGNSPVSTPDGPFAALAPLLEEGGNLLPGFPEATGLVLRDALGSGPVAAAMAAATPEQYRPNGIPPVVNASTPELHDIDRTRAPDWSRARVVHGRIEDSELWPLFQGAHEATLMPTTRGPVYSYDAAVVTTGGRDLQHADYAGESAINGWFCLGVAEEAVRFLDQNGGTYAFTVGTTTELSNVQERARTAHAAAVAPIIERREGPDGVVRDHLALVYMDPVLFLGEPVVLRPGEELPVGRQLEVTATRGVREPPTEIGQLFYRDDESLTGETVWTELGITTNTLTDEHGAFRVDEDGNPIFVGDLAVTGRSLVPAEPPDNFRPRTFNWEVRALENGGTVFAALNTAQRTQQRLLKATGPDNVPRVELSVDPLNGRLTLTGAELSRDPALLARLTALAGDVPNRGQFSFSLQGEDAAGFEALRTVAPYFGHETDPDFFARYLGDFVGSFTRRPGYRTEEWRIRALTQRYTLPGAAFRESLE